MKNPELFAARSRIQKGAKSWDVPVTIGIITSFAAILPVSALDDGRFHWAPQPDSVVWLGYALFATGYIGTAWAQSENRHFEATVRIQTDRGHHVIDAEDVLMQGHGASPCLGDRCANGVPGNCSGWVGNGGRGLCSGTVLKDLESHRLSSATLLAHPQETRIPVGASLGSVRIPAPLEQRSSAQGRG